MPIIDDNLPIGSIIIWAGDTNDLPTNWMTCNGRELSKAKYSDLADTLGANWNADSGMSKDRFNIPDLRGVFLRGVNDERNDEFKDPDIEQRFRFNNDSKISKDLPGSYQRSDVCQHQHYINQATEANYDDGKYYDNVGLITHDPKAPYKSISGLAIPNEQNPHNETRPVNAYVHYIIKVEKLKP
jgi:microcystin-dependent protein